MVGQESGLTRVPINQALSQQSTTPAIGQGSNTLLNRCLISMTSVGRIVCAHNHHRHNRNDPGDFEDCKQRRVRLVTALFPAYTGVCLIRNFRLVSKGEYRHLHSSGTHTCDGETSAGWGAVTRSPRGVSCVMFGPVIAAVAHVPCTGACQPTNTAELSGIVQTPLAHAE